MLHINFENGIISHDEYSEPNTEYQPLQEALNIRDKISTSLSKLSAMVRANSSNNTSRVHANVAPMGSNEIHCIGTNPYEAYYYHGGDKLNILDVQKFINFCYGGNDFFRSVYQQMQKIRNGLASEYYYGFTATMGNIIDNNVLEDPQETVERLGYDTVAELKGRTEDQKRTLVREKSSFETVKKKWEKQFHWNDKGIGFIISKEKKIPRSQQELNDVVVIVASPPEMFTDLDNNFFSNMGVDGTDTTYMRAVEVTNYSKECLERLEKYKTSNPDTKICIEYMKAFLSFVKMNCDAYFDTMRDLGSVFTAAIDQWNEYLESFGKFNKNLRAGSDDNTVWYLDKKYDHAKDAKPVTIPAAQESASYQRKGEYKAMEEPISLLEVLGYDPDYNTDNDQMFGEDNPIGEATDIDYKTYYEVAQILLNERHVMKRTARYGQDWMSHGIAHMKKAVDFDDDEGTPLLIRPEELMNGLAVTWYGWQWRFLGRLFGGYYFKDRFEKEEFNSKDGDVEKIIYHSDTPLTADEKKQINAAVKAMNDADKSGQKMKVSINGKTVTVSTK